jgi:hypothetical protein
VSGAAAPRPKRAVLLTGAIVGILGVLSLGTAYLFGRLIRGTLGLVDDHEILRFLGSDHSIEPGSILTILTGETEVGDWGHATRLRPLYYLFRIIESAVHHDDGSGWYLTRIVLVGLTAFGVSLLALRILVSRDSSSKRIVASSAIALLFGLLALTLPAWTDVAMRLGPSEIYVGPAIILFAFGLVESWRDPARIHGWLLLFVGYVIAVGCKENCLLLFAPVLVVYAFRFWSARRKPLLIALLVLAAISTAYVALGVALGTAAQAGDVYGNDRSLNDFVGVLPGNAYVFAAFFLFAIVIACQWLALRGTPNPFRGLRGAAYRLEKAPVALASALVVFVVLGDAFFYQSYISTGGGFTPGRYGFLSQFAIVLGSLLAVRALADRRLRASVPPVVVAVAAVMVVAIPPLGGQLLAAQSFRPISTNVASTSQALFDQIDEGITDMRHHDGAQAVLFIDDAYLEYERAYSLPQFLAYYGGVDGAFLRVDLPQEGQDPLRAGLTETLDDAAEHGNLQEGWKILPAADFDPEAYSVCFYFGEPPADAAECGSTHGIG